MFKNIKVVRWRTLVIEHNSVCIEYWWSIREYFMKLTANFFL